MLLKLDLQSEIPIYTQLRNQIIEGIAKGDLITGQPLPSVRSLAADLGINLHTVNKAYTLLKQDGFIQIHRQKGVVVNPEGVPPVDEEFLLRLSRELRPLVVECNCRGLKKEDLEKIWDEINGSLNPKGR